MSRWSVRKCPWYRLFGENYRTLVLKSVGTWGLWIISEEMRPISQKLRVGTPTMQCATSSVPFTYYVLSSGFQCPFPHIWFGGLLLCYGGLQRSNNQIDDRNEFSDRNWYFQTVLAASGGLNATLGGYHYSKPLEHGRNGFSHSKMTYHVCLCPKNHLEAAFGLRFEKCRTLVLKSVPEDCGLSLFTYHQILLIVLRKILN